MPDGRDSYHHGELREALLDAALRSLEAGRPDLSLRELARETGVSHAAPYRHFGTKRILIKELRYRGFEKLHAALLAAGGATDASAPLNERGDARAALVRFGVAYVRFGVGNAALYRLMFAPDRRVVGEDRRPVRSVVGASASSDACGDGDARGSPAALAYAVLSDAVERCVLAGDIDAEPTDRIDGRVRDAALGAWALVHGLTMLALDERVSPGEVSERAASVAEVFAEGLC